MITLQLTGIAQETDFASPENSKYFLVFNGGDLRVPVQQGGVETVVGYLNNAGEFPESGNDMEPEESYEEEDEDDDGVNQV